MATIKGFRAIRPSLIEENYYFKEIIRGFKGESSDLSSLYPKDIYIQDDTESIYIYTLKENNNMQTGVVCCVSIDDYINGYIKKHEQTIQYKEEHILESVSLNGIIMTPTILTYKADERIWHIISEETQKNPIYDLVDPEGTEHLVWKVDDINTINKVVEYFSHIPNLYIADGHHRVAATTKYCLKERDKNNCYTGNERYDHFLAAIFPDTELKIISYNRVINNLNGMSKNQFFMKISKKFEVYKHGREVLIPTKKHTFSLLIEKDWYKITPKEGVVNLDDIVDSLDVCILHDNILDPIFGISDERNDSRIEFICGEEQLIGMDKNLEKNEKIIICLYPITVEEVMKIGDVGRVVPPKSTYFSPKPLERLLIHSLKGTL